MLDGLTPFLVSFQHNKKLFLGALVVLKGAGRFTALGVYDVGILVFAGEFAKVVFTGESLHSNSYHKFTSKFNLKLHFQV